MGLDPRTPVIVGAGQLTNRVDEGAAPLEPIEMICDALRSAEVDAGAGGGGVLAGADSIRLVLMLSWRYRDPGALVAGRLGAEPRESIYTAGGGNVPQALVNRTALDIRDGAADLVLLGGAEAWRTRMALRRNGERPAWTTEDDDVAPAAGFGGELEMVHPAEQARGVLMPVQMYPMFENAHRAALGRAPDDHLRRVSELWAGFSEVAAANPYAWTRRPLTAEEIRTTGEGNRMIALPYRKLMCSNENVEQAAALVMCSVERATELEVPADRWVFPLSGGDAADRTFVSERADLASSPAVRLAGSETLSLSGVGIDDVAHVDLYSCFPSAVQIGAAELGLSLDRQLTVTGGLRFAGGPWNNYSTHAIATMVDVLRADPTSLGLVWANGGFLTKHAVGLYSATPGSEPFAHANPQAAVDSLPGREVADDAEGDVEIETYTVAYDRDNRPETGLAACLLPDGRRAWGATADRGVAAQMTDAEMCGQRARLDRDGTLTLL